MAKSAVELKEIHSWDEVPKFDSLEEESRFWDQHTYAPHLLAEFKRGLDPETEAILARQPASSGTEPTRSVRSKTVRLDAGLADKLTEAARRQGVSEAEFVRRALEQALKSA